jgi:hypothetical protein
MVPHFIHEEGLIVTKKTDPRPDPMPLLTDIGFDGKMKK